MSERLLSDEWDQAYVAGIDAAREAVEGLYGWSPPPQMLITAALDAIDALREGNK